MDTQSMLDKLVSHALTLGVFSQVNGHMPESPPDRGATCGFAAGHIGPVPAGSGLRSTTAVVEFRAVIYTDPMAHPLDLVDPAILAATDALIAAYSRDFTLGGLVRQVDLLGQTGRTLSADDAFVPFGGTAYRVMIVTIPLIVNDAWPYS